MSVNFNPHSAVHFSGYKKVKITPEQRERMIVPMFNSIERCEIKKLVPDYDQLNYPEPYLPNSRPDTLFVFHDDSTGDHSYQWLQIMHMETEEEASASRRRFIADM